LVWELETEPWSSLHGSVVLWGDPPFLAAGRPPPDVAPNVAAEPCWQRARRVYLFGRDSPMIRMTRFTASAVQSRGAVFLGESFGAPTVEIADRKAGQRKW